MNARSWLNYFYPNIAQHHEYFHDPHLMQELINSTIGGGGAYNMLSKSTPYIHQGMQEVINPNLMHTFQTPMFNQLPGTLLERLIMAKKAHMPTNVGMFKSANEMLMNNPIPSKNIPNYYDIYPVKSMFKQGIPISNLELKEGYSRYNKKLIDKLLEDKPRK
jgi:hypothetical protein